METVILQCFLAKVDKNNDDGSSNLQTIHFLYPCKKIITGRIPRFWFQSQIFLYQEQNQNGKFCSLHHISIKN